MADERMTLVRQNALEELIASFRSEVEALMGDVSENTDQMQVTAEALSAVAMQSSSQISRAGTAAVEVSQNVQSVSAAAEELSVSIEEEARLVFQTSVVVNNTADAAKISDDKIAELAEAVEKIGGVVSLIREIAKQTNLLALNATIEAARAGEAGKGFAVVAFEVKQLAKQTAKATEEVSAQIASIQVAAGDAVESIHAIAKKMEDASASTATIAAAIDQQNASTNEIFRNVQEAASGASEATQNIIGLTVDAGETSQSIDHVLSVSQDLSTKTKKLRAVVNKFLARAAAA